MNAERVTPHQSFGGVTESLTATLRTAHVSTTETVHLVVVTTTTAFDSNKVLFVGSTTAGTIATR